MDHAIVAPAFPSPSPVEVRDLPEVLVTIQKNSDYLDEDIALITRAYIFARNQYGSTLHKSGIPLITHCLELARKLWEVKSDATLIAAALLHDVLKHTSTMRGDLAAEFGEDTTYLVEGIQFFHVPDNHQVKYLENIEKLFVEMSRDLRIVIIRLVHRLDDLENLAWRKPAERKKIIQETKEIFLPLSDRLGMRSIGSKLEDLCFKHTHKDIYEIIKRKIEQTRKDDEIYLEMVSTAIKNLLWETQIHATVTGRIKNIYGLYRKMVLMKTPLEKLLDKIAIRIIVDDIATCYQVLGILHTHFVHIHGTFDDYISLPKANNYRSLHTCIYPIHNIAEKPIEIQIRTPLMHQVAEYGIAAHWKYKGDLPAPGDAEEHLQWIKSLVDLKKSHKTPRSFYTALKRNINPNTIIVFDEKGKVAYLPRDSTPLDYLHHAGIDLDAKKEKLRVNGKVVKLNAKLSHGDTIEIFRESAEGAS
jgi:GTP diphosphokinase / guanosine-3',5'-bis(diphosphate) 3'-diphosphatase